MRSHHAGVPLSVQVHAHALFAAADQRLRDDLAGRGRRAARRAAIDPATPPRRPARRHVLRWVLRPSS